MSSRSEILESLAKELSEWIGLEISYPPKDAIELIYPREGTSPRIYRICTLRVMGRVLADKSESRSQLVLKVEKNLSSASTLDTYYDLFDPKSTAKLFVDMARIKELAAKLIAKSVAGWSRRVRTRSGRRI